MLPWKMPCLKLLEKRESFHAMKINLTGTLVLVGAGKMGGAMLEGWLKAGADPKKIVALDPGPPQRFWPCWRVMASAIILQLTALPMRKLCWWL